jgi:hypothetical protein
MARLKVQEKARERGLNLSELQVRVSARMGRAVPLGTLRRYWHSTQKGRAEADKPIELVDIFLLGTIARVLDVPIGDLLNGDELGQFNQARKAA